MDILIKRKDIAAFLDERARLKSARMIHENRLEICTRLLGKSLTLRIL